MSWKFCKLLIVPDFLSFFTNFDSDIKKQYNQGFKIEKKHSALLASKALKTEVLLNSVELE